MKRYSIHLTIGHNVKGSPTFKTRDICEFVTEYLGVNAFTAMECFGMWNGETEKSTRIEISALDENEAETIRANVPVLALALAQDCIMCETRPDRAEFVEALTIEAARTA